MNLCGFSFTLLNVVKVVLKFRTLPKESGNEIMNSFCHNKLYLHQL